MPIIFLPIICAACLLVGPCPEPRIAYVGNSLTLGACSTEWVGYVGRVTNATCNTTEQRFVYYHLADAIVEWAKVDDFEPDIVVIELGIHTIVGCDHLCHRDELIFRARFDELITLATKSADEVYVLTIPWMAWPAERATQAIHYNKIMAELADGKATMVDIYEPTWVCGAECIADDLFHPNDKGHDLIADALLAAMVRR